MIHPLMYNGMSMKQELQFFQQTNEYLCKTHESKFLCELSEQTKIEETCFKLRISNSKHQTYHKVAAKSISKKKRPYNTTNVNTKHTTSKINVCVKYTNATISISNIHIISFFSVTSVLFCSGSFSFSSLCNSFSL